MTKRCIADYTNTVAYFVLHPSFKRPFFIGKNPNLLHRKSGLMFFLGGRAWVYEKRCSDVFRSSYSIFCLRKHRDLNNFNFHLGHLTIILSVVCPLIAVIIVLLFICQRCLSRKEVGKTIY